MRLVLATTNRGKIEEIKRLSPEFDVIPFSQLIDMDEIVEDGDTFAQNAMIKARAVYSALNDKNAIVLSDDSGISVQALNNQPGIYSARYAYKGATDSENLNRLIDELSLKGVSTSPAFYTAAISIVSHNASYTMHGWMYGDVTTQPKGNNGFGYDPIFIPKGYKESLGELDESIKREISHRYKALRIAKTVLKTF